MTMEDLTGFAAARGYRWCTGNVMTGVYQGYPFSAAYRDAGRTSTFSVTLVLEKTPQNRDIRALRGSLPSGVTASRYNATTLFMICTSKEDQLLQQFIQGMNVVTDLLREQGCIPPRICPICKQGECNAAALTGTAYGGRLTTCVPVHQSCCEGQSYSALSSAQANAVQGNYFLGFVGAFLGGLVGALPSVLTIYFLNLISAWLYALIPLGAYYGYKLFRGKMNQAATVACFISSFLQLFMVQWIIFYIAVHQAYEIWPSPIEVVVYFFEFYEMGEILAGMIMPAVFTVLGLFIAYGQISRTNSTQIVDANTALGSVVPFTPIRR